MVDPQVQVGCADGSDPPVGLAAKQSLLIGRRRGNRQLVSMHILSLGREGSHLSAGGRLFLDLGYLLALHTGRRNFCSQDDIPDLVLHKTLPCHSPKLCKGKSVFERVEFWLE